MGFENQSPTNLNFSIMRYLLLVGFLFACVGMSSCEDQLHLSEESGTMIKKAAWPKIIFGTRSHPCGGDGCYCEGDKGICLIIDPQPISAAPGSLQTGEGYGDWTVLPGAKQMSIIVRDDYELNQNTTFKVDADLALNADVSDHLGYRSVTILSGNYSVDYSKHQHGEILVNVIAK